MMRVGVWGAGNIGGSLIHRLAISTFVSEIHWINRSFAAIDARTIDFEHGLAYSPRCESITQYRVEDAREFARAVDVIVVTAGAKPEAGQPRATVYQRNREVVAAIGRELRGFTGTALVVSNPWLGPSSASPGSSRDGSSGSEPWWRPRACGRA